MKGIEFYHYDDHGYKKLFHYNSWRIAVLNYIEELEPENINYMECHNLTDEVFVLLEGEAVIYILDDEKIVGYKLRKNEICNIKKGVYHTHVLSKDAKLLIIEEESTSYDNSNRIYIKDEQKKQIKTIWENRNEI